MVFTDVKTIVETWTKKERQKHLNLDLPCHERGGTSTQHRGILAYYLNTNIPKGRTLLCAHACHNAKCSNPQHLYWATPKENYEDAINNGDTKNIWDKLLDKYGHDKVYSIQKRSRNFYVKGGKANNGKMKSEDHKRKIALAIKSKKRKPFVKLSNAQKKEICIKYRTNIYSYSALAKEYDVGTSSISRIVKGEENVGIR